MKTGAWGSGSRRRSNCRSTRRRRSRGLPTARRPVWEARTQGRGRLKQQVAPGGEGPAVHAARQGMAGTDVPLTVHANGGYEWPAHERNLRLLDDAGLLYIEQPLAPDELVGHVRLGQTLKTPICLDETLKSVAWARQIAELDGPKIWNIKVHRVGGLTEVCRIYRVAGEYGAELWAGTM